jgi:hypothetical protein
MNSSTMTQPVRRATPRRPLARMLATLALVALGASSCDVHGISKPGTLSGVVVSPNPQIVVAGETQQFTAIGTDFAGVNTAFTPAWTTEAGGGTISGTGLFTAGTVTGTYTNTVMATGGSKSGTATVVVVAGPLTTITITPSPTTMMIGGGQQFIAVGTDAWGNVVAFTPTWSVVQGGGTINAAGMFTAGTVSGTFANTVQASSLGIRGLATVTVTPGPLASIVVTPNPVTLAVGFGQQFTAVGRDASGNAVAITPVWSLSAGGGGIGASTGLFTAGATPGTYTNTVTATSGGISGRATVVVTPGPLATITVTPNPSSLVINTTQQYTAVGRDVGGNIIPITPAWTVVAGGGTIDLSSGLFTAGPLTGTFTNTVRANVGQVAGSATVSVTGGPLTTIVVTPNPVSMQTGAAQQFTAVGLDAGGNSFPITPVWSTGGGGTITAGGIFTAGAVPGVFPGAVRATSGAVTGSATVTVTAIPPSLTNIIVSPNPAFLAPNGTRQFTAIGTDANGNPFAFTPTWAVINGGGLISGTGLFTAGAAVGTFINTIRATGPNGATGLATVTVTAVAPVLTTITVAPNPASMVAGGAQTFTAIGRDQNGVVMAITPAWSVINGGGLITPVTGVFTSNGTAGTFLNTVEAAVGLVTGTATVIATAVLAPPIIDLGTAAGNGIMAGTEVTCVALGVINAAVAISPGFALTGFPPCTITGVRNLGNATAATQQIALTAAFGQLFGRPCLPQNFISANLGGTTITPGTYCSATSIGVTGTVTLDGQGDPNASFVFQAGTALTTAGNVVLINGAQAKNVWWGVGSSATIGTASQWQGNIIALTSITLVDNATLIGRALARQGAVTLGTGNVITPP